MQDLNWDDLRHLLAVARAGSYAAAARQLHCDETTVARRVKALEASLDAALITPAGLTELGDQLLTRAEDMESAALAIAEDHARIAGALTGTVRITSVPTLINRILLQALPQLTARHPGLAVGLLPDGHDLNLPGREADLALRLARPVLGGTAIAARKLGQLAYGIYARPDTASDRWIGFDRGLDHLPQARWLAKTGVRAQVLAGDGETAYLAALQGMGHAVLPTCIGTPDPHLIRITRTDLAPIPSRDVWLLSHSAQHHYARIRAVMAWIDQIGWGAA